MILGPSTQKMSILFPDQQVPTVYFDLFKFIPTLPHNIKEQQVGEVKNILNVLQQKERVCTCLIVSYYNAEEI
jgi:hypothetical protein